MQGRIRVVMPVSEAESLVLGKHHEKKTKLDTLVLEGDAAFGYARGTKVLTCTVHYSVPPAIVRGWTFTGAGMDRGLFF